MYFPHGIKSHIQKSLFIGMLLGVGNTVVVAILWDMLRQLGFVISLAALSSLLFSALFFLATAQWDLSTLFARRGAPKAARTAPRTRYLRYLAVPFIALLSLIRH